MQTRLRPATLGPTDEVEGRAEDLERLLDVLRVDRERRRQADDVLTGGKDEKTEIATGRDDLAGGRLDGSAEEQAPTAHLSHAVEPRQTVRERCAVFHDPPEKGVVDRVDDTRPQRRRWGSPKVEP